MRVLTITLLVMLSAVAAPVAAQEDTVTLTVSVVDGSGSPVGGAELDATWDGGSQTATTASNGKAFVDVPSGADVAIDIAHPEYVRNRPKQVRDASEEEVTVAVAPKAYLTVRTVTAAGDPIDARIVLRDASGGLVTSSESNDSGVFTSGAIEEGEYGVTAIKRGYYRNATDLTVAGETETRLALEQGSVTVRFNVRDDHFSPPQPVEGATVSVEGVGTTKTLGNGETSVQAPVNSRLAVEVTKDAYANVEETVVIDESAKRVNVTVRRRPALNVSADNERVVVGERVRLTVTDQYGAPVSDATVSVDGENLGTTDEEGILSVTIESAGDHTIRATTGSVTSGPAVVRGIVPAGTDTEQRATDEPNDSFPVSQPGFTPIVAILAVLAFVLIVRPRGGA